jgi:hypothetical protein
LIKKQSREKFILSYDREKIDWFVFNYRQSTISYGQEMQEILFLSKAE